MISKSDNILEFFTWSLAVKDIGGKEAPSSFFCDEGVVQLSESANCRQEKVPQPRLPGFHLDTDTEGANHAKHFTQKRN